MCLGGSHDKTPFNSNEDVFETEIVVHFKFNGSVGPLKKEKTRMLLAFQESRTK